MRNRGEQGLRACNACVSSAVGRRLRVRHSNLRRLFRLHRHCAGKRAAARDRTHGKLSSALPRDIAIRFLAALAYLLIHMAARLCLHPPWRFALQCRTKLSEPAHYVYLERPLARCVVELCALGYLLGPAYPCGAVLGLARRRKDAAARVQSRDYVRADLCGLAVIPRAQSGAIRA